MPRIARILPPNGVFHIICRGNNKQDIFLDDSDKDKYLELFIRFKDEHPLSIFHYCLMSNHLHLIVETNDRTNLSKFIQRLNLSYFYYFKFKYDYFGHLFQDRFKSFLVEKDSYFLQCGKYVELNPVRAGMVKSPGEYKYSSHNFYLGKKNSDILELSPMFLELSSDPLKRVRIYRDIVIADELIQHTFKGPFWGSKEFVSKMNKRLDYKKERLKMGKKVSFRKIKAK